MAARDRLPPRSPLLPREPAHRPRHLRAQPERGRGGARHPHRRLHSPAPLEADHHAQAPPHPACPWPRLLIGPCSPLSQRAFLNETITKHNLSQSIIILSSFHLPSIFLPS